jgi:hypothetical protein
MMTIDNKFNLGQEVYLTHDQDQCKRIVTAIHVMPNEIQYQLTSGSTSSYHYGFEISETKDVLLTTMD